MLTSDRRQVLERRLLEQLGLESAGPLVLAEVSEESSGPGWGADGLLAVDRQTVALAIDDRSQGVRLSTWLVAERWDLRVERGPIDATFRFDTAQGEVRLRSARAEDWDRLEQALRAGPGRGAAGESAPGSSHAPPTAAAPSSAAEDLDLEILEEAPGLSGAAVERSGPSDAEWRCPSCEQLNAARFRFCLGCGRAPGAEVEMPAAPRAPQLMVVGGPFVGRASSPGAERLTDGRMQENDLVLPGSALSRRPAQLEAVSGGYLVTDLGTGNGTFVDGERVLQPTLLRPGATLRLGLDHQLTLVGPAGASSGRTPQRPAATSAGARRSGVLALALVVGVALVMMMVGAGLVFFLLMAA